MLPTQLPEPWWDITVEGPTESKLRETYIRELRAECGPDHPLTDREARAAAKCQGCDHALYELGSGDWAIVHLTWASNLPGWPSVDAIGPWADVAPVAIDHARSH